MTLTTTTARTIAKVDVTEFRDKDGQLVDRKIVLTKDCGHVHNLSIRLDAPVPQIGEHSDWGCVSCYAKGNR